MTKHARIHDTDVPPVRFCYSSRQITAPCSRTVQDIASTSSTVRRGSVATRGPSEGDSGDSGALVVQLARPVADCGDRVRLDELGLPTRREPMRSAGKLSGAR